MHVRKSGRRRLNAASFFFLQTLDVAFDAMYLALYERLLIFDRR